MAHHQSICPACLSPVEIFWPSVNSPGFLLTRRTLSLCYCTSGTCAVFPGITSPLPWPYPMPHTCFSPSGLFYKLEQLRFTASTVLVMGGLAGRLVNGVLWAGGTSWFQPVFPLSLSVSTHHREKQLGYKLECSLTLTNVLLGLQSQSGHSAVLPVLTDAHPQMHLAEEAAASWRVSLSSSSLNGC